MISRLIAVLFSISVFAACNMYNEVDTWYGWCNHCTDKEGKTSNQVYDYQAIRTDFVKDYNEILVEEIITNHFWDSTIHDDKQAKTLIAKHDVGLWIEGNTLHFANEHLSDQEFVDDATRFKKFLHFSDLKDNTNGLNDFQLCLYKTIDGMFEKVILHHHSQSAEVELDFYYKEFFN